MAVTVRCTPEDPDVEDGWEPVYDPRAPWNGPIAYTCAACGREATPAELQAEDERRADAAACCPDPGCPGRGSANGCTFPGYADNH